MENEIIDILEEIRNGIAAIFIINFWFFISDVVKTKKMKKHNKLNN